MDKAILLPILLLHFLDLSVYAYTPLPRWGQATAVINDALYVQGGRTDEFNSQSYTSAPVNNDLLYLPLSSSFDASSPPWELLSTASNMSVSQGPAVAWHTMSAYNSSQMLIFGGFPSVTSPQVLTVRPDSAWLLDVLDRSNPIFTQQAMSWANEPIRRMRHSAITNRNGLIFIVGGEKADGSGIALSDHYVFTPNNPSFSQLSSENGPGGITGHASVILPNGTMLVFGGYNQPSNQMIPFSSIWALDTASSSYTWSTWPVASDNLPPPRRAFATVLVDNGKILIQGGSDADFQTTYSDGWELDLTQNPLTWSQVSSLSQLGQRRDHFAVSYGSEVIFGFGYGPSGPASASMQIYNPSDGSYSSSFTPPSSPSLTQSIPMSTQTAGSGGGSGGTNSTATQGSGDGDGGNGGGGGVDGNPLDPNGGNNNKKTTAIAIGTTLGVLGALAVGILVVYYIRRQQGHIEEERRFMLLNEDLGNGSSPHLQQGLRSTHALGEKHHFGNMFKNFNFGGALTAVPAGMIGLATIRRTPERRDMFADEDSRDFDQPWYSFRRRGSSWSLSSAMRLKSRESSISSYFNLSNPATPWGEKTDPFSDGAAVIRDGETGYIGAAAPGHDGVTRPSYRRQMSRSSARTESSYTDPFADPLSEPRPYSDIEEVERSPSVRRPYPQPTQPLHIDTLLPVSVPHTLSPVTEASRGTTVSRSDQSHHTPSISSHTNSNEQGGTISPFDTLSGGTSISSYNVSASPRPSSLIDSSTFQPMRRSDSWWARFSRTSFLDRHASGSRGMPEIRDPNPPPRLVAIAENQNSASPENDSPKSNHSNSLKRALSRNGSKVYRGAHGKSLSSLRTADSDAIERMAGMDVAQRERTGSHGTRGSSNISVDSSGGMWIPEDGREDIVHGVDMSFSSSSPVEMTHAEAEQVSSDLRSSPNKSTPSPPNIPTPPSASSSSSSNRTTSQGRSRRISGTAVAARVHAFEQMSKDDVSAPINTRSREERKKKTVNYGLVPRPSLFVANPDHGRTMSGSSS